MNFLCDFFTSPIMSNLLQNDELSADVLYTPTFFHDSEKKNPPLRLSFTDIYRILYISFIHEFRIIF